VLLKRKFTDGKISGVEVRHIGSRQRVTPRFLVRAEKEGWMWREGDVLILDSQPQTVLRIDREPGYYVVFHPSRQFGTRDEAYAYLNTHYKGRTSPDKENPTGVERISYYDCTNVTPEYVAASPEAEHKNWTEKFLEFIGGSDG
jgi:hypothetical protein